LKCVQNRAIEMIRSNRKHLQVASLDAPHALVPVAKSICPEAHMIVEEDKCLANDALNRLPKSLREILVLRDYEGRTYKEIADYLGVRIGTLRARYSRARQALSRQVGSTLR
jgi:RNA polymerase sigma factor (sigma-70 family)